MNPLVAQLLREALYLAVLVAAPPLVAAMAAGLVMALLQSATRIEERSLSTVPRLAAALVALAVASPWIASELTHFARLVLESVPSLGRT